MYLKLRGTKWNSCDEAVKNANLYFCFLHFIFLFFSALSLKSRDVLFASSLLVFVEPDQSMEPWKDGKTKEEGLKENRKWQETQKHLVGDGQKISFGGAKKDLKHFKTMRNAIPSAWMEKRTLILRI